MTNVIGVMGGKWTLPSNFPSTIDGNAGDMIHTMAPLSILKGAVHNTDRSFRLSGAQNFRDFVNNYGSHLVLVLANTFRNGVEDGSGYARLQNALEQYTKPIVVFGLGVQAATANIDDISLPDEAVELMRFLSTRCEVVGVRGAFTKQVFEEIGGVSNVMVTGCPSLYARPDGIRDLREAWKSAHARSGRFAFNVTNLSRPSERQLLARGIQYDGLMVEPVSRYPYEYHTALKRGEIADPPYYFKSMLKDVQYGLSQRRVEDFYRDSLYLFRTVEPWLDFNREYVRWTYGTRFHVNMASLLAGVPALWLTHDSRTTELAEFMHLPHVSLEAAAAMHPDELHREMGYDEFFDNINGLFDNFSDYLQANGLPGITAPL